MTVNRIEISSDGKRLRKDALIPGYRERLRTPFAGLKEFFTSKLAETVIDVDTDDQVTVTQQTLDTNPYHNSRYYEEPRMTKLSKHQINDHSIQSPPSLRGRIVRFEWTPSKIVIPPDQEQAIKQLREDGTYTEEDAVAVRDNIIYQIQKQRERD